MKTTLDLPDDLMIEVKVLAARQNRKMKDIIAESLRRDLGIAGASKRHSIRDVEPVSVGEVFEGSGEEPDRLEEMLDERGHRY